MKSLQQQLSLLLSQRPKAPAADALDEVRKAYQQRLAEWNARVDSLRAQLEEAIARLNATIKQLEALTSSMSTAQAKDVAVARAAAAEARTTAEKTIAEAIRLRAGGIKTPRQSTLPAPTPAPGVPPPA